MHNSQPFPVTAEEVEFCATAERWKSKVFGSGPITPSALEAATTELVRDWFLPDFRRAAAKGVCRFRGASLEADWWQGLHAFSSVFSREIVGGVGHARERTVDFDTFGRHVYARARSVVGSLPNGTDLPASWHEDPAFAAAWADAVRNMLGDHRMLARFTLALHWDTFSVPLRFFADTAALSFLRSALFELPQSRMELDTYRKDIRGDRSGLGLKGPIPDSLLVKSSEIQPNTFRVNRANAEKHGFVLTKFRCPVPGQAKPLVFEIDG